MTTSLQMRITPGQELVVVAALIAYIAFTNGFQVVRSFLATSVGKAIGLAIVVYVWKCVSPVVALLLTVSFVRCAGMREGLENAGAMTYACPEGTTPKTDMPGKCAKMVNGMEVLVDGTASGSVAAPPPQVTVPEPPPPPPPTTTPGSTAPSTTTTTSAESIPSLGNAGATSAAAAAGAKTEPFGLMSSTTSFSPL